jgi:hypothetical protein
MSTFLFFGLIGGLAGALVVEGARGLFNTWLKARDKELK